MVSWASEKQGGRLQLEPGRLKAVPGPCRKPAADASDEPRRLGRGHRRGVQPGRRAARDGRRRRHRLGVATGPQPAGGGSPGAAGRAAGWQPHRHGRRQPGPAGRPGAAPPLGRVACPTPRVGRPDPVREPEAAGSCLARDGRAGNRQPGLPVRPVPGPGAEDGRGGAVGPQQHSRRGRVLKDNLTAGTSRARLGPPHRVEFVSRCSARRSHRPQCVRPTRRADNEMKAAK